MAVVDRTPPQAGDLAGDPYPLTLGPLLEVVESTQEFTGPGRIGDAGVAEIRACDLECRGVDRPQAQLEGLDVPLDLVEGGAFAHEAVPAGVAISTYA